jgi:4-amino-4-deoxy-L-arabinose transferase-like glycosyltransferase
LTRWELAALSVILAAAAFVRFYHIDGPSLWMDEIWSIEMSAGRGSLHDRFPAGIIRYSPQNPTSLADAPHWWKIWSALDGYPHPPLYPILLRWWMDIFGNGPAATRGLSALFDLAAIAVFFDVCRFLHGNRIALLACALMALSIGQIDFAQETRSYALLILLGMCCCDLLVRMQTLGSTSRRWIMLAAAVAATALTH